MLKVNGQEFEVNGLSADKLFSKAKIMYKSIKGAIDKYICLQIPLGYSASKELMKHLSEFNGEIEIEDSLVIVKFRPYDANLHSNDCDGKTTFTLHFDEISITDKAQNISYPDYIKFGENIYPCAFDDGLVEVKYTRDAEQINFIKISASVQNNIGQFFEIFSPIICNPKAVELGDENGILTTVQSQWKDIEYYFDCFPMDTNGENLLIRGDELCG